MPFIMQSNRKNPNPNVPGELCYIYYKEIIDEWRKLRSWTTADRLFKHYVLVPLLKLIYKVKESDGELPFDDECYLLDHLSARILAYAVFFIKEVMPYENEKENENGSI